MTVQVPHTALSPPLQQPSAPVEVWQDGSDTHDFPTCNSPAGTQVPIPTLPPFWNVTLGVAPLFPV